MSVIRFNPFLPVVGYARALVTEYLAFLLATASCASDFPTPTGRIGEPFLPAGGT
ncbi:hypothetical protein BDV10DRAFT_162948 [Aspergillus recurvatus]